MTVLEKFQQAAADLERAISFETKAKTDPFYYGGIAKAYEVAIEYAWKYFRTEAIDAGLEAESPRDAIKQAGVIGILSDVEKWLKFLKIRNIAVHDYLGVSQEEYIQTAKDLSKELNELQKRLK